jgi:sRNA-binding protein
MNTPPIGVTQEQPLATADAPATPGVAKKAVRQVPVQPVLEKLYELYPKLFGAEFLPLKLGIFQELLTRHPEHFERAQLKAALAVHTRSTRYLQSIANGKPRYSLEGDAVDAVAPEHVFLALLELFRRRQARSPQDLRPRLRQQLTQAFEASGLSRQDYLTRVQNNDLEAYRQLEEALAERDQRLAREEALRNAFTSSGKGVAEFAQMYGLRPADVDNLLK